MDYDEAMAFLDETKKYGSRPGLTTIRSLMHELGDAQERVPAVHIGGTNGKGSVGAMLSVVLTEAGYRVGWFNTPDVFSYEEEFRINGVPIAKERLAEIFTEVREACERLHVEDLSDAVPSGDCSLPETQTGEKQGHPHVMSVEAEREPLHPTRFEVETAAAFLWFWEERCDFALVEVGMGGALDATNLITKPLVSVLTSIGMDHMRFLGDTLEEIAAAKAGIVKPGCPVVTVPQEPDVMQVIRARCDELQALLYVTDPEFVVRRFQSKATQENNTLYNIENIEKNEEACYCNRNIDSFKTLDEVGQEGEEEKNWNENEWKRDEAKRFQESAPDLCSPFMAENASCARQVLEVLRTQYPDCFSRLTDAAIASGLKKTVWPGRYERLRLPGTDGLDGPLLILDGAHNPPAARRLREALDADFPNQSFRYLMGVLADKDYESMARILFRPGDRVLTVTPPNPRALPAPALADALRAQKIAVHPCETVQDAISYIKREAQSGDIIVALGSLSYLGTLKQALK